MVHLPGCYLLLQPCSWPYSSTGLPTQRAKLPHHQEQVRSYPSVSHSLDLKKRLILEGLQKPSFLPACQTAALFPLRKLVFISEQFKELSPNLCSVGNAPGKREQVRGKPEHLGPPKFPLQKGSPARLPTAAWHRAAVGGMRLRASRARTSQAAQRAAACSAGSRASTPCASGATSQQITEGTSILTRRASDCCGD